MHVDLWVAAQKDQGAEASAVRRRLSALSSFYRYCAAHDLVDRIPIEGVTRPVVDPDYTATVGLAREEARALVAAADADRDPQALRTAAVIRLLLHNALRVDEACAADVADLSVDAGHRVLRVTRKGARKAKISLTPARWPRSMPTSPTGRTVPGWTAWPGSAGRCWPPPPAGRLR